MATETEASGGFDVGRLLVDFLTGQSPLSAEMQALWMAIQGAVMVRNGVNRERKLHWFHAFALSVMAGFAGGWLGFFLMGKPSAMYANDLSMASAIIAFVLVNYTPLDIGYKVLNSLPMTIVTVSWAQLFRSLGICKFVTACFDVFKDAPSAYYPIPVFGPIMYATLLGNWGGFLMKGFEGHVANGMPWPVQNGLFCASFFHFFVNDTKGPIGIALRKTMVLAKWSGLDDRTFATVFVSSFMQIMGILQIPAFLGPSFTPFGSRLLSPFRDSTTWSVGKIESKYSEQRKAKDEAKESGTDGAWETNGPITRKRRRNRNKNKVS